MNNKFPFPNKPKSRTAKEATRDEENATHVVTLYAPECGTAVDMDFFRGAGQYSDFSGCDREGNRDHGWYVQGEEAAKEMKSRLMAVAQWLDYTNRRELGITVKVTKKK